MKYLFTVFMLVTFSLNAQVKHLNYTFDTTIYTHHTIYVSDSVECVVYNHNLEKLFVDNFGYPAFRYDKVAEEEKRVFLIFYGPIDEYYVNIYKGTNTYMIWVKYDCNFTEENSVLYYAKNNYLYQKINSVVKYYPFDKFEKLKFIYNQYIHVN